MTVKYHCKICGAPGTVELEEFDDRLFKVEFGVKIMCCIRCSKYYQSRRRVEEAARAACFLLMQCRATVSDAARLEEVTAKIRDKLSDCARRYAEIVCRHWRKSYRFDDSFTDDLMKRPDRCGAILGRYENNVRKGER